MKTFDDRRKEADQIIEGFLREEKGYDRTLIEAMNYSIRAGGKRLRPVLLQSFGRMYGADEKRLHPFMAAIEMIHTYSLVHDDLPAMDNDMLRRGKPTTHARFGEAMAILAGDALLNEAFTIMSDETKRTLFAEDGPLLDECFGEVYATSFISKYAGVDGMAGGQSLDVETDKLGRDVTGEEIHYIYLNKTSALLEASMLAGAVLGGSGVGKDISLIARAGKDIGFAFQIRDDILDIEGDESIIGKETGQDKRNGKSTFVSIHGIEESEAFIRDYTEEAKTHISNLENVKDEEERIFVLDLFDALTERNH
ncbi:MAG: polyprenyl synthetase family protein [Lachnospiraceae bacterium]|nr:polyprenyl synthetase family protein [Lachnospiraceae bacterium]